MTSRGDVTDPFPLWLRALLLVVALALRLASRGVRLVGRTLRLAGAGWRQLVYIGWDALQAGRHRASRDGGHGAPPRASSSGSALRARGQGVMRVARAVLAAVAWFGRRALWPATVLGAAVGLALLLAQVDAPASPARGSGAKVEAARLTDNPFEQQRPSLDEGRVKALRGELVGADGVRRRKALEALLAAQPADLPLLDRELLRVTRVPAADYKAVLRRIGAAVPDRHGRFGAKAVKKGLDWLDALLQLDRTRLSERLARARDEALYSVALIRGLVATGRSEAGTTLLLFAYRHDEAFRDACGRALRAMGGAAVPALVRAPLLRHPLAYRMVRYASYQLDRMNRSRPELALANADPLLRVELLHAYGEAQAPSAVPAVVAHTEDADADVRRAARWATLRYVTGEAPKAAKRQLTLAGGKTTERARSLYLTYRQLARRELAARLAKLEAAAGRQRGKLEEIAKGLLREHDGVALAERLFVASDLARARAYRQRYEGALKLARGGKRKEALALLDRLLASQPEGSDREEIGKIYLKEGEAQLAGCGPVDGACYARAALALSKALALLEGGSSEHRNASALRLIAEAQRDGGAARAWRLQRALALVPASVIAQRQVDALRHARRRTVRRAVSVAAGSGLACLVLLLLWRRRRSR